MRFIKEKKIINPGQKINFFNNIVSTFFYSGYIPKASGTFGSLVAILFFIIPGFYSKVFLSVIILILFFVSLFTVPQLIKKYGNDPSVVVVDEAVGMWISVNIVAYVITIFPPFYVLLISFLTFRFFDIIKIPPANYFDKMKNSFGVMMDDVIAGIYSGVLTVLILYTLKYFGVFIW